jgi:hypothetical protein
MNGLLRMTYRKSGADIELGRLHYGETLMTWGGCKLLMQPSQRGNGVPIGNHVSEGNQGILSSNWPVTRPSGCIMTFRQQSGTVVINKI